MRPTRSPTRAPTRIATSPASATPTQTDGGPAGCATFGQGPNATHVFNNTVWTPTGAVTECGMTLAAYQAKGGDVGTTAGAYPDDSVVLNIAKQLMGL